MKSKAVETYFKLYLHHYIYITQWLFLLFVSSVILWCICAYGAARMYFTAWPHSAPPTVQWL